LVGLAAIPLLIDLGISNHRKVYEALKKQHPCASVAKVTGRLVDFPYSMTDEFGILPVNQLLPRAPNLPNYVIEVEKIDIVGNNSVLYGAQWVGLGKAGLYPIYCNVIDSVHSTEAVTQLRQGIEASPETVEAVFDPERLGIDERRLPKLNEYLRDVFQKG
jgi:hypothetical protein